MMKISCPCSVGLNLLSLRAIFLWNGNVSIRKILLGIRCTTVPHRANGAGTVPGGCGVKFTGKINNTPYQCPILPGYVLRGGSIFAA